MHPSREVVLRDGNRYRAPNAADKVILNWPFYRDVIIEPTNTNKQSETLQPIEKQPTEHHMEEPLHNNFPPDPQKLEKKLRELAGLETLLGDA
jgi:hypothetical protein